MRLLVAFIICLLYLAPPVAAQTVTGQWYGVGYVKQDGEHHSYLAEMILTQKGTKVTGEFNYYFKTDSFKTKLSGVYRNEKRWLELFATPILNYQAKNKNGAECNMEGDFILKVSQLESTLTGQFNPTYDYRLVCPAITIKFVKYIPDTTHYEPEPEQNFDDTVATVIPKDTIKPIKTDTAKPIVKAVVPQVIKKDTIKASLPIIPKKDTIPAKPVIKPVIKDSIPIVKRDTIKAPVAIRDTIRRSTVSRDTTKPQTIGRDSVKKVVVIQRTVNPNEKYIRELYRRSFELVVPVIEVDADSLKISFYDNGEIDNDTISIFLNRKPLKLNQMLSDKPIQMAVRVDTSVTEISMFAENLGRIAPNTAVAVIYAGEQRYELNLSSSFVANSTIRFKRKQKNKDPKNIN